MWTSWEVLSYYSLNSHNSFVGESFDLWSDFHSVYLILYMRYDAYPNDELNRSVNTFWKKLIIEEVALNTGYEWCWPIISKVSPDDLLFDCIVNGLYFTYFAYRNQADQRNKILQRTYRCCLTLWMVPEIDTIIPHTIPYVYSNPMCDFRQPHITVCSHEYPFRKYCFLSCNITHSSILYELFPLIRSHFRISLTGLSHLSVLHYNICVAYSGTHIKEFKFPTCSTTNPSNVSGVLLSYFAHTLSVIWFS